MNGPMPGPIRPPTNHPKVNMMIYYAMGAIVLTFSLASAMHGYWRLVAIPFGVAAVLLSVASVRAGIAAENRDPGRGRE